VINWVWATLGIESTDDPRVIRSAYATILKSFDPDGDQPRFAQLRQARDLALQAARSTRSLSHGESLPIGVKPDVAAVDREKINHCETPEYRPEFDFTQESSPRDALDEHYSTLFRLLHSPENGRPPDADKADKMLAHFRLILTDSRMEQLTFRAAAEEQIFHLLSTTIPQSDPLLHLAIDEFGWRQRDGQIGQSNIIDTLIRYADDSANRQRIFESSDNFRDQLEQPDHEYHLAWRELKRSSVESTGSGGLSTRNVAGLVTVLQEYFPPLLAELNEGQVIYWQEKYRKNVERRNGAIGLSMLFIILTLGVINYFHLLGP